MFFVKNFSPFSGHQRNLGIKPFHRIALLLLPIMIFKMFYKCRAGMLQYKTIAGPALQKKYLLMRYLIKSMLLL